MKAKILSLLLAWVVSSSFSSQAAPAISTTVNGVPTQIGTLDAFVPNPRGAPRHVVGEFLFSPGMGFLDECYDFTFLNIETRYRINGVDQATDPVVGTLPAIDPQPGGSEDHLPYYFTEAEFDSGVFGSVTIHDQGVSSRFSDSPRDGTLFSVIDFTTYLVAVPEDWSGDTVCLLGWFNWTYDNNGDWQTAGFSTVGTVSSVLTAADQSLVADALNNARNDFFEEWQVELYCELECPVPETGTMAGAAFVLAITFVTNARRRLAAK